jgi:hypothetical protein
MKGLGCVRRIQGWSHHLWPEHVAQPDWRRQLHPYHRLLWQPHSCIAECQGLPRFGQGMRPLPSNAVASLIALHAAWACRCLVWRLMTSSAPWRFAPCRYGVVSCRGE